MEGFVTVKEISERLDVSRSGVYRLFLRFKVPSIAVNGRRFVRKAVFEQLLRDIEAGKVRVRNYRRPMSEENRRNIAAGLKGRKWSPEQHRKFRQAKTAHSPRFPQESR